MSHDESSPNQTTPQDSLLVETDVNVPQPEKTAIIPLESEQEDSHPEPQEKNKNNNNPVVETVTLQTHFSKPDTDSADTFKEEQTTKTSESDLSQNENKPLQELKNLIQQALNNHEFSSPSPIKEEKPPTTLAVAPENATPAEEPAQPKVEEEVATKKEEEKEQQEEEEVKETVQVASVDDDDGAKTVEAIEESVVNIAVSSSVPAEHEQSVAEKVEASLPLAPEEVTIYGIPLLADERTDVILTKFLRARDFKAKEAFTMIKNTILWRKEFGIEELMDEKFGDELEKVVYMHGFDKEGHPVCYNIYGEFQNKELYKKCFSDEEKRQNFLRWRIQFLEKSIRNLDFNNDGICTIVQVNDLKDSPGPAKWELRQATKQALQLLQDNYPEFVAKQVFINVPWWYLAVNRMISPFLTQRTKSKFVFAGPSKSTETLLSYIAPEQLSVKYGGLSKDGEFGNSDAVTEITIKPASKHTVEFPVTEKCLLSWEVRVIGWEVNYGAEFVPSNEESYTVIVQKARKVASSEEPVLCNSFKIGEPGKVVLTIDNTSSRKKKLLYRLKTKSSLFD
ncbi:patellin-3-like protein [Trifolium pratense]|uniref:Patellin-3-like protein n=1 Tax=Trifolium pratense TaxID=57577 RepID=A0A2K3PFT5_TRIPR|nr:patellin-3-like protein [Trifolium pratense]